MNGNDFARVVPRWRLPLSYNRRRQRYGSEDLETIIGVTFVTLPRSSSTQFIVQTSKPTNRSRFSYPRKTTRKERAITFRTINKGLNFGLR